MDAARKARKEQILRRYEAASAEKQKEALLVIMQLILEAIERIKAMPTEGMPQPPMMPLPSRSVRLLA
jgi:hypothetical protein